jgi:hypothetical protein
MLSLSWTYSRYSDTIHFLVMQGTLLFVTVMGSICTFSQNSISS